MSSTESIYNRTFGYRKLLSVERSVPGVYLYIIRPTLGKFFLKYPNIIKTDIGTNELRKRKLVTWITSDVLLVITHYSLGFSKRHKNTVEIRYPSLSQIFYWIFSDVQCVLASALKLWSYQKNYSFSMIIYLKIRASSYFGRIMWGADWREDWR